MNWLIIYILFLHWIGDFVCQSDWMAQNKSKNWSALFEHVVVYSCIVVFGQAVWNSYSSVWIPIWYGIVNGVLHIITDAITSRINSILWQRKQMHWFFVSVGLDQLIHTTTLIMTLP